MNSFPFLNFVRGCVFSPERQEEEKVPSTESDQIHFSYISASFWDFRHAWAYAQCVFQATGFKYKAQTTQLMNPMQDPAPLTTRTWAGLCLSPTWYLLASYSSSTNWRKKGDPFCFLGGFWTQLQVCIKDDVCTKDGTWFTHLAEWFTSRQNGLFLERPGFHLLPMEKPQSQGPDDWRMQTGARFRRRSNLVISILKMCCLNLFH